MTLPRWISVAIYARVSKRDTQTTAQQIAVLVPWILPQCVRYEVVVESRTSLKARPKLDALRARVLAGEFDALVVWKLDRLARNGTEGRRWREDAESGGFDIVSFSEAVDLSTPFGRFAYDMVFRIAELERDTIAQRTKLKLDLLRKKGIVPGRRGGRIYDPTKAAELYDGLTVRALAEALGVSPTTAARVQRRLRKGDPRARRRAALEARFVPIDGKDSDVKSCKQITYVENPDEDIPPKQP